MGKLKSRLGRPKYVARTKQSASRHNPEEEEPPRTSDESPRSGDQQGIEDDPLNASITNVACDSEAVDGFGERPQDGADL